MEESVNSILWNPEAAARDPYCDETLIKLKWIYDCPFVCALPALP